MLLPAPYLLHLGDVTDQIQVKTSRGVAVWRPELCVGQYRLPGASIDLGLPDLSFEEAATAQPLSVSLHAVADNCVIAPGDSVLVLGPGVIGLGAAQAARLMGAATVVVAGLPRDERVRLPAAQKLGFPVINALDNNLGSSLERITGRNKADVVIECSGDSENIAKGLSLTARGGHMTIIGISALPASVFYTPVVRNEIQVHTTFNGTWANYDQALRLMAAGKIDMRTLISTHALGEAVSVFDAALECDLVKPVLCPQA